VTIVSVLLLGVVAGILVGLLGIGGGIVMVPAMVYLLHMDQHLAQGTSLFVLLPPIGLGALRQYWKAGNVDLRAGILCALGMILGAYIGGKIAVPMPTQRLKGLFGGFLMLSAVLLWMKAKPTQPAASPDRSEGRRSVNRQMLVDGGVLLAGVAGGIASGMFGIGGGVILIPILGLLLGFSQHRAQGTSLVALIPPTGLLAVIAYARADYLSWKTGLLLIPGVFLGGIAGGNLAKRIPAARMRRIFASLMFLLGISEVFASFRG
jgi:uncharacterized membrane protein YfcA